MRRLIGQPAKPGRHPNPEIRRASRSQQQKGRAANARRVLRARLPAHHRDQTCRPGIDHPIAGWLCVHRSSRTTKGAAAPAGRTGPVRSASPRGVGRRARSTGAYADAAAFVAREGSCATRKPGRHSPTCPVNRSRFRTPSKTSDLRSAAPSPKRNRDDAPSPQRSRHRRRPVARSRSQSHRVLALVRYMGKRTVRACERPELLARPAGPAAPLAPKQVRPSPPMKQKRSPPRPASRGAAPTDGTRASAFARMRSPRQRLRDARRRRAAVVPDDAVRATGFGFCSVPGLLARFDLA